MSWRLLSMSLSSLIKLVTMAVTEGMLNMGVDCARQKMEMRTNHTCGKTNLGKYKYISQTKINGKTDHMHGKGSL